MKKRKHLNMGEQMKLLVKHSVYGYVIVNYSQQKKENRTFNLDSELWNKSIHQRKKQKNKQKINLHLSPRCLVLYLFQITSVFANEGNILINLPQQKPLKGEEDQSNLLSESASSSAVVISNLFFRGYHTESRRYSAFTLNTSGMVQYVHLQFVKTKTHTHDLSTLTKSVLGRLWVDRSSDYISRYSQDGSTLIVWEKRTWIVCASKILKLSHFLLSVCISPIHTAGPKRPIKNERDYRARKRKLRMQSRALTPLSDWTPHQNDMKYGEHWISWQIPNWRVFVFVSSAVPLGVHIDHNDFFGYDLNDRTHRDEGHALFLCECPLAYLQHHSEIAGHNDVYYIACGHYTSHEEL